MPFGGYDSKRVARVTQKLTPRVPRQRSTFAGVKATGQFQAPYGWRTPGVTARARSGRSGVVDRELRNG